MVDFDALVVYLTEQTAPVVTLTLAEIERLAGPLPDGAYTRGWWRDSARQPLLRGRLTALGWRVAQFDRDAHAVTFMRGGTDSP